MKALAMVLVLSLAAAAQAGEQKIVETETGITVEYSGTPQAAADAVAGPGGGSGAPAATAADLDLKARSLAAQLAQLRREVADLLATTGKETPEELALKKGLADDKRGQIEAYVAELNQLTGKGQQGAQEAAQSAEQTPAHAPSYRAEKKQQIRELKLLRQIQPPPN